MATAMVPTVIPIDPLMPTLAFIGHACGAGVGGAAGGGGSEQLCDQAIRAIDAASGPPIDGLELLPPNTVMWPAELA
jgi:hypothetical protein